FRCIISSVACMLISFVFVCYILSALFIFSSVALLAFPTRRSSDLVLRTIWVRYCGCSVITYFNICATWELILVSIIDVVLNLILFIKNGRAWIIESLFVLWHGGNDLIIRN